MKVSVRKIAMVALLTISMSAQTVTPIAAFAADASSVPAVQNDASSTTEATSNEGGVGGEDLSQAPSAENPAEGGEPLGQENEGATVAGQDDDSEGVVADNSDGSEEQTPNNGDAEQNGDNAINADISEQGISDNSEEEEAASEEDVTEDAEELSDAESLALQHADDVADGTYVITSSLRSDGVIDAKSAGTANGTAVQLYAANGSKAQRWKIYHDADHFVVIENVNSGKVLDVSGGIAENKRALQLYSSNNTPAQRWIAVRLDDGAYQFISALDTDYAIDLPSKATSNGTRTQLYQKNATGAQKWQLTNYDDELAALDQLALTYKDAVPDGVYAIKSEVGSNRMVLDVSGGSKANGGNVQIYASNGSNAQRWQVKHNASTGYVTLTCVGSGKVLDVKSGLTQPKTNVQQYADNGSRAQQWILIPNSNGSFTIQSALWPKCVLDVSGGKAVNKTNVQLYTENGSAAQRFSFVSADPSVPAGERYQELETSWFVLQPSCASGKAVDIASASLDNGANAQLYTANGSMAQLFTFVYCNGYYQIKNASSGKALDVSEGDVIPGTNVQQWTAGTTNDNQLFAVTKNQDGTYTFVNKGTGLALDIYGASSRNGANVDAYTPNGTAAQRFMLKKQDNLIQEGVYAIRAASNTSMVLDVKSGSTDNGANIQLYSSNSTTAQRWYFAPVKGKSNTYTIESVASAKLLTMDSNGAVTQRAANGSTSQQWIPIVYGDGIALANASNRNKVLDIYGGSIKSGTKVQTYSSNSTKAQRFRIRTATVSVPNGTYVIQMAASTKSVLDVASGSLANGANVRIYASNNTGAQKWNVSKNSDGTYTIINAASGKALDVKSASATSGANVQQYASNKTKAQKWLIIYAKGGFRIQSALSSNLVLDVSGGSTSNGANVQIYKDNGSSAQRFVFKKTTYTPPLPTRQQAMYNRAQGMSSSTKWLLMVDTTGCRVGVFNGSKGNWKCKYYWMCSPGKPSTPTVLGSYRVTGKGYSFGHGYTCYYYTQFYGDYLFHSVLYNQGTRVIQDGRLGQQLSHGCVRLAINNAKWIYDNIPLGTKVYIYK